jgi:hypothetical protein
MHQEEENKRRQLLQRSYFFVSVVSQVMSPVTL